MWKWLGGGQIVPCLYLNDHLRGQVYGTSPGGIFWVAIDMDTRDEGLVYDTASQARRDCECWARMKQNGSTNKSSHRRQNALSK